MMSHTYYPQVCMTLRVRWEDFNNDGDIVLNQDYVVGITPKKCNVKFNDYTQADTFSCELDYKNFPFDPRTIRAVGITIHGENKKQLVDPFTGGFDQIEPTEDNKLFLGFADEDSIELDNASRLVRLEGRDLTGLLIDKPFDQGSLNMAKPISVIIQKLLLDNEDLKNIWVLNKTGEILPTLAQFAPSFTPLGTKRNRKKNESYWDVIQDIIARAGLIAYMELDKLVINKPRSLYKKDKTKLFIYGENVSNLRLKRKIGRLKDMNIRVRSLVPEEKTVIIADIPREASVAWSQSIGVLKKDVEIDKIQSDGTVKKETAPFITFRIPNIKDKDHLISVGEKIYEELGRQQIEGSLETRNMLVCEKNEAGIKSPSSTLLIRNATPIEIEIDNSDITKMKRDSSKAQKQNYLISHGYDPLTANAMSKAMTDYKTPFYTKAVEYDFDSENGFKCSLEFLNFIELSSILGG